MVFVPSVFYPERMELQELKIIRLKNNEDKIFFMRIAFVVYINM